MFPPENGLKRADALLSFLFNFALDDAFRRVQVNQGDLKLNGTHQLLIYPDDISILVGSIHTLKRNTGALLVSSKESGLEVNDDKLSTWSYLKVNVG